MSINQLTTSNTFGDWLITTNELVTVANSILIGTIGNNILNANYNANAAYDLANTTNTRSQSAYDLANTINTTLQSAYDLTNLNFSIAQASYNQSNTSNNLIYSLNDSVDSLWIFTQSAYDISNITFSLAEAAYSQSNVAYNLTNTTLTLTQSTYDLANTLELTVQSAYDLANTLNVVSYFDVTNINLYPGVYGNSTLIPVITVESNGRISQIANAPINVVDIELDTTSTNEQYLLFTDTVGTLGNLKISNTTLSFNPSAARITVPNVVITGSVTEKISTITSPYLFALNGGIQFITIGSNIILFTYYLNSGESIKLYISNPSNYTVTWSTVAWQDGVEPTLSTTKYTGVELTKIGNVVFGTKLGDY